jgi:hypothetical protein
MQLHKLRGSPALAAYQANEACWLPEVHSYS